MSRFTSKDKEQTSMPRATPAKAQLTGGDGQSRPDSQADALEQILKRLESLEQQLAVQLQRTGELQAQLDRAIAERPITTPK
jgi:hypothetical protein